MASRRDLPTCRPGRHKTAQRAARPSGRGMRRGRSGVPSFRPAQPRDGRAGTRPRVGSVRVPTVLDKQRPRPGAHPHPPAAVAATGNGRGRLGAASGRGMRVIATDSNV